jgi:ribose transport system substrate-binding protein
MAAPVRPTCCTDPEEETMSRPHTRRPRSRPWLTLLLTLSALLFAACGEDDSGGGGAAGGGGGKPASDLTVGYAGPTLNNAFFVGLSEGVKRGARERGFEVKETNANGDAQTQFNDAQNLISQGVDALILTPIDQNGIVPAVQAANAQNIPVFTLDRGAKGGKVTSFVETDNVKAGRDAADYIAKRLKERYGEARGNVVDLVGLVGTSAAADREKGFSEGIAKYPGIKVVARQEASFDQEKALNVTSNILQANKKIDAIFGANDDNTIGAIRAIDAAKRFRPPGSDEHIIIVGIDGTEQALEAIRAGKQDATISQNPIKMAAKALDFVEQAASGEGDVPQRFFYPTILIEKDNIDSPEVKEYGLWSQEVEESQ